MKSSAVNETKNLPTLLFSSPSTGDLPLFAGATNQKILDTPGEANRRRNTLKLTVTSSNTCANTILNRSSPSCGPRSATPTALNIIQAHTTLITSAARFLIQKTEALLRPLLPCTQL